MPNPRFMRRFHSRAAWFWMANFPAATAVYIWLPSVWDKVSVLYLVYVSLWANLSTDWDGEMTAHGVAVQEDDDA